MIHKIRLLPADKQVLFFITLVKSLIKGQEINEKNTYLSKIVHLCSEWLLKKNISADDLYKELENLDETGILSLMDEIEDKKRVKYLEIRRLYAGFYNLSGI